MTNGAGTLNDMFIAYADRIGRFVQTMLALGAALGLLLGSGTAFVVARSMTQPLKRVKDSMMRLAADPSAGKIEGVERRDELGAMARATDFFVTEIGRPQL
jgi:HAMP domain-containing protein